MSATNQSPAFQWYPKDYLTSVRVAALTLEQEGAYRRALDYCWLHGSLPFNDNKLAVIIGKGCTPETAAVIKELFEVNSHNPEEIFHERLEAERVKQKKFRKQAREAAAKSVQARAAKSKSNSTDAEPPLNDRLTNPQLSHLHIPVSNFQSPSPCIDIINNNTHTLFKNWFENFYIDGQAIEKIAAIHKCSIDSVLEAFEEFKQNKVATGEVAEWHTETDMRKHFNNWIPSYIQRKNNPKHTPFKKKNHGQPDPDKIGVNSRAEVARRLAELLGTNGRTAEGRTE